MSSSVSISPAIDRISQIHFATQLPREIVSLIDLFLANTGWTRYQRILQGYHSHLSMGMVVPLRRTSNLSLMIDSVQDAERNRRTVFIADEEIVRVHPMRYLRPSPFSCGYSQNSGRPFVDDENPQWDSACEAMEKALNAVALTEDGKHVILQQAFKSCVPTCVAMLLLDLGKAPNYSTIQYTRTANDDQAMDWIRDAGLTPTITLLPPQSNHTQLLCDRLMENGSGILGVEDLRIGGHSVILDAISLSVGTAIIRDPCHGWAITIRLEVLLSMLKIPGEGQSFIQILPNQSKS